LDERLKTLYEAELHHLETHAAEFVAKSRYSRIAERLGLGETAQLRDPFVDWLLDGSAFLSARIQHLIESEFPRFTQSLLSIVYPHLAAPTPSMMIAQFGFDQAGKAALGGPIVPKNLALTMRAYGRRSGERKSEAKKVTFTTGRSIRLWPIKITEAEFLPTSASLVNYVGPGDGEAACGIRVKIELQCEGSLGEAALDQMDLYLAGGASIAPILFEALGLSNPKASVIIGAERRRGTKRSSPIEVAALGFDGEVTTEGVGTERDALLPYDNRSFDGYRLLHEFFALPERFHFIRLSGLQWRIAKRRWFSYLTAPSMRCLDGSDRKRLRRIACRRSTCSQNQPTMSISTPSVRNITSSRIRTILPPSKSIPFARWWAEQKAATAYPSSHSFQPQAWEQKTRAQRAISRLIAGLAKRHKRWKTIRC